MFVHFTSSQDIVDVDPKQVEAIVTCILQEKQVACDEVSIHCVTSEDISRLHEEYFNDPSPTDCITFPIDDKDDDDFYKVLGEIFVCPAVALSYSQAHILDFEEELTLYIVHGLLHLLGFDDIEEEDETLMREQEFLCMNILKEKKLILSFKKSPSFSYKSN